MRRIQYLALATMLFAIVATGGDPFYAGGWKITTAAVAPWWREKAAPDAVEKRELIGKTFVIRSGNITGPRQFACGNPRFEVKWTPADYLFEGMLEKVPDQPRALAALGFKGKQWQTLSTGCETELEFHFIDANTLAFALNNYIYVAKKN